MGYVSLFSNARAGAQQSIDPIVASLAGMARQQGAGMNSGGPYTSKNKTGGYSATSCTCGSCPLHRGVYGAGNAKRNDTPSYGRGSGYGGGSYAAGSANGGSMTSTPSFGYHASSTTYGGPVDNPSHYSHHTQSQYE
ncbi:TPA: hypothetical protein HA251_03700 [Candidatus Woesearchaeota archaeon]|nr:hypothetical protein [Candidatus Woesearchaeota archaeon]